jgi:ubiquinone/menaquinone biosynthesis C-methylase UbiE
MSTKQRLREHAQSFQAGADGYDRHRPSYPIEAVEWLLGDAEDVVDLGAGTGKLTVDLVSLGASVTAVDPSADMLRVLSERMPEVESRLGTGEQIPLADASVDLVTVAQAWHWLDVDATSAEVLRVLRPHGWLALIWNTRDESVPWVGDLTAALRPGMHGSRDFVPQLGEGLVFTGERVDSWNEETTREGILNLATTRSYYLVASDEEKQATLARINTVLDAYPETRADRIQMPYVTQTWIAQAG